MNFSGKALPFRCPGCRELFEIADTTATLPAVPAVPVEKQPRGKSKRATADPFVPASSLPAVTGSAAKKTSSSPGDEIKCEICEDGEDDATSFCVPCVMYFCAGCQRAHKKPRVSAGHEFVSVEKALKGKMKVSIVPLSTSLPP